MKKAELANWIGREIVIQAPNDKYHGAGYGIVDEATTYAESSRFTRGETHHPAPEGKFYKVRYTGTETYRDSHRARTKFRYVPLSHLRPESADDHQARYLADKVASEANDARLKRERAEQKAHAERLVEQLGIGQVHTSGGTSYVLLTVDEAQQVQTNGRKP